jgi:hypothetical protein
MRAKPTCFGYKVRAPALMVSVSKAPLLCGCGDVAISRNCPFLRVADHYFLFFGGLIMMCAPAVPEDISHGALSLDFVESPVDSGVANGT